MTMQAQINHEQVVDLTTMDACTVRDVLNYFGEALASDCGHCDRCLGEPIPPMPPESGVALSSAGRETIASLIAEAQPALASPRQIARFLCGLSSPAASRAGPTRDPRFGKLAHVRFHTVMNAADGEEGAR